MHPLRAAENNGPAARCAPCAGADGALPTLLSQSVRQRDCAGLAPTREARARWELGHRGTLDGPTSFGGWDLSRRWICGSAGSLATFCSSISTYVQYCTYGPLARAKLAQSNSESILGDGKSQTRNRPTVSTPFMTPGPKLTTGMGWGGPPLRIPVVSFGPGVIEGRFAKNTSRGPRRVKLVGLSGP